MVDDRPHRSPCTSSRQSMCASICTIVIGPRPGVRLQHRDRDRVVTTEHHRHRAGGQHRLAGVADRGAVGLERRRRPTARRRGRPQWFRRPTSVRRGRSCDGGECPNTSPTQRGSRPAHPCNTVRPTSTASRTARRSRRCRHRADRRCRADGRPRNVPASPAPNIEPRLAIRTALPVRGGGGVRPGRWPVDGQPRDRRRRRASGVTAASAARSRRATAWLRRRRRGAGWWRRRSSR